MLGFAHTKPFMMSWLSIGLCRVGLPVGSLLDQSCLLNTFFCFKILQFMRINFLNSWTTKVFVYIVDHVLLCCISLFMLPFAELFPSELLFL